LITEIIEKASEPKEPRDEKLASEVAINSL